MKKKYTSSLCVLLVHIYMLAVLIAVNVFIAHIQHFAGAPDSIVNAMNRLNANDEREWVCARERKSDRVRVNEQTRKMPMN